ncbi:MAG: HAD-IA family hydrolase [Alphaproteobacteria bacterium]
MNETPALIIFDCDGTLVDSEGLIVLGLQNAFKTCDVPPPARNDVRRIIGLNLHHAVARLLDVSVELPQVEQVADAYRAEFVVLRDEKKMAAPLFEGTQAMLEDLLARQTLMGVATGKSAKGLQSLYTQHDLARFFVTSQTADFHPSKPHPSMLETAMAAAGSAAGRSVMIGDTTYDIEMGRHAGMRTIGVSWGNHDGEELMDAGADIVINNWAALTPLLQQWGLIA